MAKQGTQTAYQQVRPVRSDVTQNMWRANENAQQLEYDRQDEAARVRQENIQFANDLGTSLSKIKLKATGMGSIDEMYADVAIKAKDRLRDAYLARKKDPNDVDAIMTIKNLEALPESLDMYTKKYGEYVADISKGVQDGKYSGKLNLDNLEKLNRTIGQNNGYFELGKDGSLIGVMVDPEKDGFEFKPIQSVLDGTGLDAPVPKADYFGAQTAIKGRYSTHKNSVADPNDPYNTITTESLRDGDINNIRQDARQLWGTYDEPTDFAKSTILDELNQDLPSSKAVFEKYVRDFGDDIIGQFKTTNIEKKNFTAEAADGRLALAQSKEAKKSDKASEADEFRTQIDGALAGDPKYVKNLEGIKIDGTKSGRYIEKAEHVNGKLILGISDGEIVEMDKSKDGQAAVGKLMGMADPGSDASERLAKYDKGKATKEFKEYNPDTDPKLPSSIKLDKVIPTFKDMKKAEAVKALTAMGVKGFKTAGFYTQSKVQGPDGTVYSLGDKADLNKLKKYILENATASKTKDEPKAETETETANQYGI